MKTPRQRAESLLTIHGGSCSVFEPSDIAEAFRELEKEGLVKIHFSDDPASGMIDIRAKQPSLI